MPADRWDGFSLSSEPHTHHHSVSPTAAPGHGIRPGQTSWGLPQSPVTASRQRRPASRRARKSELFCS